MAGAYVTQIVEDESEMLVVWLAGFFMAALTALAGPLIEILLIKQFGLYHYNHTGPLGIPTWIPWVYFCGAPAVGMLGRKVRLDLLHQSQTTHVAQE